MSNTLKLNTLIAKNNLKELSDDIFVSKGIKCDLQKRIYMGFAKTVYDVDTGLAKKVIIGTKDSKYALPFVNHISDQKFAQVIINIYHEYAHCQQANTIFQKEYPNFNDINQAVCDMARCKNESYYRSNYFQNPNEIDAEGYGVSSAYEYLCAVFPNIEKEQHEQIICDVVNEKSEKYSYWIHHEKEKPFSSISEIKASFRKAYNDSFEAQRTYFVKNPDNKDLAKLYMSEDEQACAAYLNQQIGWKQDRIIATINNKINPALKSQYICLRSVDLSYETNILDDDKPIIVAKSLKKRNIECKTDEQLRVLENRQISAEMNKIDKQLAEIDYFKNEEQSDDYGLK